MINSRPHFQGCFRFQERLLLSNLLSWDICIRQFLNSSVLWRYFVFLSFSSFRSYSSFFLCWIKIGLLWIIYRLFPWQYSWHHWWVAFQASPSWWFLIPRTGSPVNYQFGDLLSILQSISWWGWPCRCWRSKPGCRFTLYCITVATNRAPIFLIKFSENRTSALSIVSINFVFYYIWDFWFSALSEDSTSNLSCMSIGVNCFKFLPAKSFKTKDFNFFSFCRFQKNYRIEWNTFWYWF